MMVELFKFFYVVGLLLISIIIATDGFKKHAEDHGLWPMFLGSLLIAPLIPFVILYGMAKGLRK